MSVLVPVTILVAVLIKTFLGQVFYVPSGSMERTIHGAEKGGDRVVVNKLTTHLGHRPQRGEVVVFHDELGWLDGAQTVEGTRDGKDSSAVGMVKQALTFIGLLPSNNEKDLIKRVIGVGGDEVACFQGKVFVNGSPLDEPYVFPGDPPCKREFAVRVPFGRLFVMGDHRAASADSTFHLKDRFQGTVAVSSVVGPAYAVVLPFDRAHRLPVPQTFK